MTKSRKPLIGGAFDSHFMNEAGCIASYLEDLRYYRPRGFSKLAREGATIMVDLERIEAGKPSKHFTADVDVFQAASEWKDEVDSFLTEWARRVTGNDYICFGPFEHGGSVGFYHAVESAIEDCDLRLDAGDSVPRGFSGQVAFVTDHGNVSVQRFSRGRMTRELFAAV